MSIRWIILFALLGVSSAMAENKQPLFASNEVVISSLAPADLGMGDYALISEPEALVDIYTAEWCGVCKRAMRYMEKEGISYNAHDIDASEHTMNEYQRLGGFGVPLIVIGEQRVSGFDPGLIQELLAEI